MPTLFRNSTADSESIPAYAARALNLPKPQNSMGQALEIMRALDESDRRASMRGVLSSISLDRV